LAERFARPHAGQLQQGRDIAAMYRDLFGPENYYIELQDHAISRQTESIPSSSKIASRAQAPDHLHQRRPVLWTADADAHDVLLCIGTGSLVSDTNRLKYDETSST